jgi:hypothetical protein
MVAADGPHAACAYATHAECCAVKLALGLAEGNHGWLQVGQRPFHQKLLQK